VRLRILAFTSHPQHPTSNPLGRKPTAAVGRHAFLFGLVSGLVFATQVHHVLASKGLEMEFPFFTQVHGAVPGHGW
jgi:hypothetical protein